jgi:hypothetical protein
VRLAGRGLALVGLWAACAEALRWFTADRVAAFSAGTATVDEAVAVAAAGTLWLCLAWVALGTLVELGTLVPGAIGGGCASVAAAVAPRAMRGLVVASLGISVLDATAASGAIAAAVSPPSATPPAFETDHVLGAAPRSAVGTLPPLDRPGARPLVTVEAGDCLWTIVRRHLGPQASAAEIATEWPRWYAANRTLIGPDPDLIQPGQQLAVPR